MAKVKPKVKPKPKPKPPTKTPTRKPTRLVDRIKSDIGDRRTFRSSLDLMTKAQQEVVLETLRAYVNGEFGTLSIRGLAQYMAQENIPITRNGIQTLADRIRSGQL